MRPIRDPRAPREVLFDPNDAREDAVWQKGYDAALADLKDTPEEGA